MRTVLAGRQSLVHKVFAVGIAVLLLSAVAYLAQGSVHAAPSLDWTAPGQPVINSSKPVAINIHQTTNQPGCTYREITVRSKYTGIIGESQTTGCVVRGEHLLLAHTSDGLYVSLGSDRYFYRFHTDNTGIVPYGVVLAPGTDRIGFQMSMIGYDSIRIYDDFSSRITLDKNTLRYHMTNLENRLFPADEQATQYGVSMNLSNNGRYMVYQSGRGWPGTYQGVIRVDLETGEQKQFGYAHYSDYANPLPLPHYAISNDGSSVAGGGISTVTVWSLSEACVKDFAGNSNQAPEVCPSRTISSEEYAGLPGDSWYKGARTHGVQFNDDASELSFIFQLEDDGGFKRINLSPAGYVAPKPQLDYLALGDSYSSGEGDIERRLNGGTYYLEGTNVAGNRESGIPEEMCHISSRSYPFVLLSKNAIGGERVRSVACSGAKRVDVQGWNTEMDVDMGYAGQRDSDDQPRLRGFNDAKALKGEALNTFIPGRVQQIEFIEATRPEAATLTIGGNDLEFSRVIEACLFTAALTSVCDYATEQGRKDAGNLIRSFRMQLVDLYEAIREASPKTKLYVMGYPQFISSTQDFCGANSSLNQPERKLITESVTYINQVVKAAAHEAGAYYVDIEDALGDKILCTFGADKYVNGAAAVLQSIPESFHPNAKGHAAIASRIKEGLRGQMLEDFNSCADNSIITCPGYGSSLPPDVPEYLNPPSVEDRIIQAADMVRNTGNNIATGLRKGSEYVVRLNPFSVQPTTIVNISLHSNPVNLGDFTVAADGSLEATIEIPLNIPAGYHTLYVTGETFSGEGITFRQIVQVQSSNSSDIDDNGIPDTQQPCGPFTIESGIDADLDGIDDACDPHISEEPELYRVRLGSAERSYGSSPENENHLYIERNTRAIDITGISGDYDQDKDGWAVVGVSQDGELEGINMEHADTAIGFDVLGDGTADSPYYPVVYIYSEDKTCTAYRPASVAVVAEGDSRGLVRAWISNDKCYQDLSEEGDDEGPGSGDTEQQTPPDDDNPPNNKPSPIEKLKAAIQTVVSIVTSFVRAIVSGITTKLHTLVVSFRWR